MANDNLSGAWRYLVQNADSNNSCNQPPKDLEDWIEFPQPRISDADRQSFWNNTLPYNSDLNCFSLEGLNVYAQGGNYTDNSQCSGALATFSDFNNAFPAWDNSTLDLSGLSSGGTLKKCLWIQDKAGGISHQPFEANVAFDNTPPDNSSNVANLSISPTPNTTDNFMVSFNTTDSDTFAFLFQIDNSTGPSANQLGWIPLGSH